MTVVNEQAAYTKAVAGQVVSKVYTPLVVETKTLFNVTGLCLITGIYGLVTTVITVANTVKLQANPTVGATQDLCSATDIGTTDTPAGNLLTIAGAPATALVNGVGAVPVFVTAAKGIAIAAGTIEQVTATGADGGITWYLSYVPLAPDAAISGA